MDAARALPWVGEGGRLLAESAARLRLEQGRPAEALWRLTESVVQPGIANPAWAAWRGLKARALAGLGRAEEAVRLAEEEVALCVAGGRPRRSDPPFGCSASCAADSGTADLREAVELLSGTTATLECARAQTALGRSPDVADAEAVPLLRSALAAARACGARSVARDAGEALARRGHAPGRRGCGRPDPAHRPQRRVLDLAAAGLDVNEVAQRLFLTPGTVRAVLESASGGSP